MIFGIIKLLFVMAAAFLAGKCFQKIKLPAILGWLITGMVLGPHALGLMDSNLMEASWYQTIVHVGETSVGLMIGTELVWKKIRKSGKAIVITTLTQSLGTFFIVSLVFGIIFHFMDIPLYLALMFGGIALATAPAPALSVVREFKTDGPVTRTLIPMAALDDIVGCMVFFGVIAYVAGRLSQGSLSPFAIAAVIVLPILIGILVGYLSGRILKKDRGRRTNLVLLICLILLAYLVGWFFNSYVMPAPILNFMLIGMAFSATFANMLEEKRLDSLMGSFNPILGICLILMILNLGAPLDYHLIMGAGVFTAVYILSRATGKYFGAYFGAAITHSPDTVRKYLGLTLLPHSGVSLVFTGIAVSVLSGRDPDSADIIQGTIAAAAVINEIIAVIVARKGFALSGEFGKALSADIKEDGETIGRRIITISREHGSGGREIGRRLSKELGIPFYDDAQLGIAAKDSGIDYELSTCEEMGRLEKLLYESSSEVKLQQRSEDRAFLVQAKVIRSIAKKNDAIIVGRCADFILKDMPGVLKVFIHAEKDFRADRIRNIYHEKGDSSEEMRRTDERRSLYYSTHTGRNFGDARNYDLSLSSSTLGLDRCVEVIKGMYYCLKD